MLTPIVPDRAAPLPRANPAAKLGAAALLLVALFVSVDGVTAGIVLAGLVVALAASGIPPGALAGRAWPIGVGAVAIGILNIVLAAEQVGPVVLELGPLRIGLGTVVEGIGLALRLLAIVLAGLLATATTDPTDLADSLVQQLRVSPRFAVGALAALRLLPLFAHDWQTMAMARRARGVDPGRSPVAVARLFAGQLLALLVAAIRRGTRMATAMEARGFGAAPCRTSARRLRVRPSDWAWIAGAAALGGGAVAVSMALGTWRPLIGG